MFVCTCHQCKNIQWDAALPCKPHAGLRAMFFVIDELVKLFSLLKYGVGLILCFIGVKLLLKGYVYFPPMLVSGILFATLATSMVASVVYEKYFATEDDKDED